VKNLQISPDKKWVNNDSVEYARFWGLFQKLKWNRVSGGNVAQSTRLTMFVRLNRMHCKDARREGERHPISLGCGRWCAT
jgi:hypothetical protein